MNQGFERRYGLLTAICMVVGIVIGSGVFFKAQTILQATNGNMPLGILAWIIGGVIMLVCSLAFATMATKYEKVNGIVDYAEATVGHKYAYFIGWFMTTIYYPTLTSVLAWLSARYTLVFIQSCNPVGLKDLDPVTGPECMVLTLFFLCAAYFVNAISPRLAGKFQVSTTVIKLIPIFLMAIVGTIIGLHSGMTKYNFTHYVNKSSSGGLFAAIIAASFAYEGWIIATSINAELKNAKKNLPLALVAGTFVIMAVYVLYYIGIAGTVKNEVMMAGGEEGAKLAFEKVFSSAGGTLLFVLVVISCLGTLNGLMMGCSRGIYSLAARGNGPKPEIFSQIDPTTNMPVNSAIFSVLLCAIWLFYFYGANLTDGWFGFFDFDSSELPIVTVYALYIPIFINFIRKEKDLSVFKRFIMPCISLASCVFMIIAACISHKTAVIAFLIVFAVVMAIGALLTLRRKIS